MLRAVCFDVFGRADRAADEGRARRAGQGGLAVPLPNLLIRRSGQVVEDRPSPVVGWAGIPGLSTCVGRRSVAWLQSWLQSRWNGADPRPSAFQAGHIPSWRGSCECYALSPVAAVSGWLLPLLSPLPSGGQRYFARHPPSTTSVCPVM
jgi:hypothetical protein